MKKAIMVVLAGAVLLSACSSDTKKKWGLEKQAPNEFLVESRAPLTLPKDFNDTPVNTNMTTGNEALQYRRFGGLTAGEKRMLEKVDAN